MRRLVLLLVVGLVAAVCSSATSQRSAATPQTIRWLALGDSFSSGEGIPGANVGNASLQGKADCQRANGDGTDAKAYSVVAVEQLQANPPAGLTFEAPFFVACTGAIADDAGTQLSEMRQQVPAELQQWDVVSLSFGGNNIKFAEVIQDCIDVLDAWGSISREGCTQTDAQLRKRVDMLVGRTAIERDEYAGTVTLPSLYDQVAGAVRPGGHVVVVGYPQLLEEPDRWASWIKRRLLRCQGVLKSDIRMLRGVTGYLNEQIALAVADANAKWKDRGVTFDFVDVATKVYETSTDGADRHGLCAGDQWINGITTGWTSGDLQHERSFHPTNLGHLATGRYLAALIRRSFSFGAPASAGAVCDSAAISASLGQDVALFTGLCQDGWAYVDTCVGCGGDTEAIVRFDGTAWTIYTYFPSVLCRADVVAAGAPVVIVDSVTWPCDTPDDGADGVLQFGDRGDRVRRLQQELFDRGYGVEVDGAFGPGTELGVRQAQDDIGIAVDGMAGPMTQASLGIGDAFRSGYRSTAEFANAAIVYLNGGGAGGLPADAVKALPAGLVIDGVSWGLTGEEPGPGGRTLSLLLFGGEGGVWLYGSMCTRVESDGTVSWCGIWEMNSHG